MQRVARQGKKTQKLLFKVSSRFRPLPSNLSESSRQGNIEGGRFISMKIKQNQEYGGWPATGLFIRTVTNKIHDKITNMRAREIEIERQQAESYQATICHELRTPL